MQQNLQAVIDDPNALKQLTAFAEKEHSSENLTFYLAAREYQKLPADKLLPEANKLYTTYIKPGAESELPIDGPTKDIIAQRLNAKQETGEGIRNLFEKAAQLAFSAMKDDLFRFVMQ